MPVFHFQFQSLLEQRNRERVLAQGEFARRRDQLRLAREELNRKQQDHQCAVLRTQAALDLYKQSILDPERWPEALKASDHASRLELEAAALQKYVDAQHAVVVTLKLHAFEAAKALRECRRQELVLERLRELSYDEFRQEEKDCLEAEREEFNISKYAARRKS